MIDEKQFGKLLGQIGKLTDHQYEILFDELYHTFRNRGDLPTLDHYRTKLLHRIRQSHLIIKHRKPTIENIDNIDDFDPVPGLLWASNRTRRVGEEEEVLEETMPPTPTQLTRIQRPRRR